MITNLEELPCCISILNQNWRLSFWSKLYAVYYSTCNNAVNNDYITCMRIKCVITGHVIKLLDLSLWRKAKSCEFAYTYLLKIQTYSKRQVFSLILPLFSLKEGLSFGI